MNEMKKNSVTLVLILVLCFALFTVLLVSTNLFSTDYAQAETGEIAIDETNFPDTAFRQYVSDKADVDGSGFLSDEEIAAVTEMGIADMGISSLKGINYFTALESLYCYGNNLWSIDLSENTALEILYCNNNNLSSLDLSKHSSLQKLDCSGNNLYSINVNGSSLLHLNFEKNKVKEIDLSGFTSLTYLNCDMNDLTDLDLTKNVNLLYFYCANNELTQLNLKENVVLNTLDCSNNKLTQLDLNKNTSIQYLDCANNGMTILKLNGCTNLATIDCTDNGLSELNLNDCTKLKILTCHNNDLRILDLSNNKMLTSLYCANNKLLTLDVSMCESLSKLDCDGQEAEYAAPQKGNVWELDLSEPLKDWAKVSGVSVTDGTLGSDGKTVTFDGESAVVKYAYATGFGQRNMFITLTLTHGFRITVEGGIIAGTGETLTSVAENGTVTVTAQPPEGMIFEGWSTDGGKTIISQEVTYTFNAASDTALKAVYSSAPTSTPETGETPSEPDETPSGTEDVSPDSDGEITPSPAEPDGLSDGAIAGIVIGSIAGALIIAYAVCAILFKKGIIKGAFLSKLYPFIKDKQ